MKCNYCGTTIPEGNKICNGCGKKVTIFSNFQNSNNVNNNYKIIDNYTKQIKQKKQQENLKEFFEQSNITINQVQIQDKNAITAMFLSILGIMFIPIGIILNIIALTKAKQIENEIEKEKILKIVKILLVVSSTILTFFILSIIITT